MYTSGTYLLCFSYNALVATFMQIIHAASFIFWNISGYEITYYMVVRNLTLRLLHFYASAIFTPKRATISDVTFQRHAKLKLNNRSGVNLLTDLQQQNVLH